MFLITGCGRSGTKYMAALLCQAGLDVGHEKPGKDGVVDWHGAVGDHDEYDVVLHQVRDPFSCIGSMHTAMGSSWRFAAKHVREIDASDPKLVRCMKYWYYWNLLAEKSAEFTFRVEDWDAICRKVIPTLTSKEPGRKARAKMRQLPKNLHSRRKKMKVPAVSLVDLRGADNNFAEAIVEMARRYGYEIVE